MVETHLEGNPVRTNGDLPAQGTKLDFTVVGADLGEISASDFAGSRVVLNIFPSIDTGVCATSVRKFNEKAAQLENTKVLCISKDLPFALGRFCGAEGIEDVVVASDFRTSFGSDNGLVLQESPLQGLLARAVIILDEQGTVQYVQLVDEIKTEPDYDAALAALQ